MFSHLGAVLLASGALVLLSEVHSVATVPARPHASIMLVTTEDHASQTGRQDAPVRAIGIEY